MEAQKEDPWRMSMKYFNERLKIIEVCKKMCELDYFAGTWGNVSMRIGDEILLTPSRVDYDTMKPEDIVVIDMDGNKISGDRNATSEKEVHRQIYLHKDNIFGVIHAHTANAMAIASLDINEVPALVEEMSQLLGGSIPITPEYVPAQEHVRLGEIAGASIGDKNAVILRNHGPVAAGKDLDEAVLVAKITEKACGIFLNAQDTGYNLMPIPKQYVDSERYRYLYTYGHENT